MKTRRFLAPAAALLAAGCATLDRPSSAQGALRDYYGSVREPLPVAPPGVPIDTNATVTRIAFGSCLHQDRHQTIWSEIAATDPDLFLMIGDNVYGDTRATGGATIPTLTAAYERLSSRSEFRDFRSRVPMAAVWDDHDLGHNDGGGAFAFKEYAERIFEHYWRPNPDVRSRPGVYQEIVLGPDGKRVQIIMLDTRFFRSDLQSLPYQEKAPPLGWYVPSEEQDATILGDEQWRWLERALEKPADLRLIVSSIQVLTDAHGFEKWGNFPEDRERLLSLLDRKNVTNAVLLSGDRHQGALYRSATRRDLYELTSSSLNFSFARPGQKWSEPDPIRIGDMIGVENFGLIDINWKAAEISLSLVGSDGASLVSHTIPISRQ